MSSNLKQKLRICFRNSLQQCSIKVILECGNRLPSLFRFKDIIRKELQSHRVYKFLCGNCNVTYCSKTKRHLNVRPGEHFIISHLTKKRVECKRHLHFQFTFYCESTLLSNNLFIVK